MFYKRNNDNFWSGWAPTQLLHWRRKWKRKYWCCQAHQIHVPGLQAVTEDAPAHVKWVCGIPRLLLLRSAMAAAAAAMGFDSLPYRSLWDVAATWFTLPLLLPLLSRLHLNLPPGFTSVVSFSVLLVFFVLLSSTFTLFGFDFSLIS